MTRGLVDRLHRLCVLATMRIVCVTVASLLVLSCGGKSNKDKTTASGSSGSVSYEKNADMADIDVPSSGSDQTDDSKAGGGDRPAGGTDKIADKPKPKPKPKPVVRPPGQDLSDSQKRQLVAQHVARAKQGMRSRDADLMIRAARAALEADETSDKAMVILAHAYYFKGYDVKAQAILDIAVKKKAGSSNPVLWMLMGLLHDRNQLEDKALEAYKNATSLRPSYAAAWTNLGVIYLKRKRYKEAVAVFQKVTDLEPRSPRGHMHLGAAHRGHSADFTGNDVARENQLKNSELAFKTSMSKKSDYSPAYFNLGLLYLDADPFPGLNAISRYTWALKYLNEYKRTMGSKFKEKGPFDDYLAAAEKGLAREKKREEKRKKREARKRKKAAGGAP